MNFRNVPEPLVYTRGQPLYWRPSLEAVTWVVEGLVRTGVTHRASLSEMYTRSTSSNSFSDAKRTWARGGGEGSDGPARAGARISNPVEASTARGRGPAHLRRRRALESGAVQRQDGAALRVALGRGQPRDLRRGERGRVEGQPRRTRRGVRGEPPPKPAVRVAARRGVVGSHSRASRTAGGVAKSSLMP